VSTARRVEILERLRLVVPEPPPPPKRLQKTWQTLEVGRHLRRLSDGSLWEVTECSNHGALLVEQATPPKPPQLLSHKDWREHWAKIRKGSKPAKEIPE